MPGGPEDGTVIPSFGGHVSAYIWGGQERNVLRCLSRTQLCSELGNWRAHLPPEHLEPIDGTGLRVDGSMVSTTPSTDVLRDACSVTLDMTEEELNEKCGTKTVWQVLGGCLFLDKSGNRTHPSFFNELFVEDVQISEYSWGSAVLAYMYRQLGTTSRRDADSIAGCLTLLQAWIYEYFPCFQPQQGTLTRELAIPHASAWDVGSGCPNKSMERLLAFRARLDHLTDNEVNWLPYGVDPA
ncbi:protein MAIN-LIKE 1-like [Chenopodium quinoa]|uniref:protein MAIN-LIKE 1-like n=1 Tax=Chenopodium quinoa TaxID=63459 RepID=UPI000B78B8D1|nr:protein MAIN-LIKE 1-like [Chenopodium quinoa]